MRGRPTPWKKPLPCAIMRAVRAHPTPKRHRADERCARTDRWSKGACYGVHHIHHNADPCLCDPEMPGADRLVLGVGAVPHLDLSAAGGSVFFW